TYCSDAPVKIARYQGYEPPGPKPVSFTSHFRFIHFPFGRECKGSAFFVSSKFPLQFFSTFFVDHFRLKLNPVKALEKK
ncbi:hypothetical protein ACWKWU_11295, partial [Chitinophaga lutea]